MVFDLFSCNMREFYLNSWGYFSLDIFAINHQSLLGISIDDDLIEFQIRLDILFISFNFTYIKKSKEKGWFVYTWFTKN